MNNRVLNVTFKTRVRDDSITHENPFRWEDKTADLLQTKTAVLNGGLRDQFARWAKW